MSLEIAKISILHCKSWSVYKKKAQDVVAKLSSMCKSEPEVVFNSKDKLEGKKAAKRGSFEVFVTLKGKKEVKIWSGLELGPPRKLKFPDEDALKKAVKKHAK